MSLDLSIFERDTLTYGERYRPAMDITDPEEARQWFEANVAWNMRVSGRSREEAVLIEKGNLGYFAGYFDQETMARVHRVFGCCHPIFGGADRDHGAAASAGGFTIWNPNDPALQDKKASWEK